jgi:hypothetical protein
MRQRWSSTLRFERSPNVAISGVWVNSQKSKKSCKNFHQKIGEREIDAGKQGDQIGRMFDCWAIVYLRQLFESYEKLKL